jgi:hypothetical protein
MEYVMMNGGKQVTPTLLIITGQMGNRGINFAFRHGTNPQLDCHVTHQIVGTSCLRKDPDSGELLEPLCERDIGGDSSAKEQKLRCCGNFRTRIPVKVYTDMFTKNVILKNYHAENILISKIRAQQGIHTTEAIRGITLNASEITSHFCKQSLRKVGIQVLDDEDTFVLEELEDEEVEAMKKRLQQRAEGRASKIKQFMNLLDADRIYTKQEIQALLVEANLSKNHYLHLFRNHGAYGRLMQKLPNNQCRIYHQLRETFKRYFTQE